MVGKFTKELKLQQAAVWDQSMRDGYGRRGEGWSQDCRHGRENSLQQRVVGVSFGGGTFLKLPRMVSFSDQSQTYHGVDTLSASQLVLPPTLCKTM